MGKIDWKDFFDEAKNFAVGAGIGLLALVVGFGGYDVARTINANEYSSLDEISALSQQLDADDTYILQYKKRMKHNGDEPIYVKIDENFPKEFENELISALDHVFGIVGEINPKYRYKLVDSLDDHHGKTTIHVRFNNDLDFKETTLAQVNYKNMSAIDYNYTNNKGYLIKNMIITFQEKLVNNPASNFKDDSVPNNYYYINQHKIEITMIHELLHCFGFDDVYVTPDDKEIFNTIMKIELQTNDITLLTPNDYKLLRALYAPDFKNDEEKQKYIEESLIKIDEYSKKYYQQHHDYHEKYLDEVLGDLNKKYNLEENVCLNFDKVFVENSIIHSISIAIKNGEYVLTTYDIDGKEIEHCSGKTYYIEGTIYLQDVRLRYYKNLKQYNADLYLRRSGNPVSNHSYIYDLANIRIASKYESNLTYHPSTSTKTDKAVDHSNLID